MCPIVSLASFTKNVEPSKFEAFNDDHQLWPQFKHYVRISVFSLSLITYGKRGGGHGQLQHSSDLEALSL